MNKTIITSAIVATVVSALVLTGANWLVGGNQSATVGGSRFQSGLSTSDTQASAGDLIVSDDIDIEASAFCIDFHSTSTETVLSMVASSTATIEGVDGVVMFEYGSCQ